MAGNTDGNRDGNRDGNASGNEPGSILSKYTGGGSGSNESSGNAFGNSSGSPPGSTSGNESAVRGGLVTTLGWHAQMLDFRFRGGTRRAFPYSYLAGVDLDPSAALVCRFASATVTVTGRNLEAVYAAVTTHTAIAVIEDRSGYDDGGDLPFIQAIAVEDAAERS